MTPPFARTECACDECVACCKRQPGPLAPGDFERIAAHLGEAPDVAAAHFWASPGAIVGDRATGKTFRIGSITPRLEDGRCVFLGEDDRCGIHTVAPVGCAYFDTHMNAYEGITRGTWLVRAQTDEAYQKLRSTLPPAESYKPTAY